MHFNPRSREGSDAEQRTDGKRIKNFNPRSREGSDVGEVMDKAHGDISIHAPAKGATWVQSIALKEEDISIHAPAKGATVPAVEKHLVSGNFNPRSREGSDLIGVIAAYINYTFQSTLPRRERPISVTTSCLLYSTFQSTLPRRERRQYSNAVYFSSRFQSTLPRRERLPFDVARLVGLLISIHAPAKGATGVSRRTF